MTGRGGATSREKWGVKGVIWTPHVDLLQIIYMGILRHESM